MQKETRINTAIKWQNDLNLTCIQVQKMALPIRISHATGEISLAYLKFCSLPLTTAKLEHVRKSLHGISLLQS